MTTSSGLKFQRAIQYATMQPGALKTVTYQFIPDDPTTKTATFSFPIDAANSIYHTPFGYPVSNPSFSVDLTCSKQLLVEAR